MLWVKQRQVVKHSRGSSLLEKMDMLGFPDSGFPFFRALSVFLSTFRTAAQRLLNPGCEELMKEPDVVLELALRARAQP